MEKFLALSITLCVLFGLTFTYVSELATETRNVCQLLVWVISFGICQTLGNFADSYLLHTTEYAINNELYKKAS